MYAGVFDHFITTTTVGVTWGKCVLTAREKTLAVTELFSTVFTPTALLRLLLKSLT